MFTDATQDSPATPDVGAKAPEYRANQESDVLLVGDRRIRGGPAPWNQKTGPGETRGAK